MHSSSINSRERLTHDVFDTVATHAGRVYDIIDTDAGLKMPAFTVMFLQLSKEDV